MNLLRIASVTSAAALLAGLSVASVQAQTGVFSPIPFEVNGSSTPGVVGLNTGTGTFIQNGTPYSPAAFAFIADFTGGANDAFGVISAPLVNFSVEADVSGNVTELVGAGTLVVTSGNLVSFADSTITSSSTTYPGETVTGFSFTFTASPTPTVTGGTTIVPGLVVGGTLNSFSGTDGVAIFNYSSVPEPGVVSLLAGLAVAGTGLGLRRLRQRNA